MPVVFQIPVAVARAVVNSDWLATASLEPGTATFDAVTQFKRATEGRYKRNAGTADSAGTAAFIQILETVLPEVATSKDAPAISRLVGQLTLRMESQLKAENRKAEEEAAHKQERDKSIRKQSTKARERTMSPEIESLRHEHLKQIGEDYDLPLTDPQIRAALVAAFHAGAISAFQATDSLRYGAANYYNDSVIVSMDKLAARDKARFEAAHARAGQEVSDAPA